VRFLLLALGICVLEQTRLVSSLKFPLWAKEEEGLD